MRYHALLTTFVNFVIKCHCRFSSSHWASKVGPSPCVFFFFFLFELFLFISTERVWFVEVQRTRGRWERFKKREGEGNEGLNTCRGALGFETLNGEVQSKRGLDWYFSFNFQHTDSKSPFILSQCIHVLFPHIHISMDIEKSDVLFYFMKIHMVRIHSHLKNILS